jgi:hypothetical protein
MARLCGLLVLWGCCSDVLYCDLLRYDVSSVYFKNISGSCIKMELDEQK